MAAVIGCIVAWACSYLPGGKPLTPSRFLEMTDDCARQAAAVAIPIAAIGIIIGIAVQSNLAIKFSTEMLASAAARWPARCSSSHSAYRARHGPADGRRLCDRRNPVRARAAEARRGPAGRAFLRAVLLPCCRWSRRRSRSPPTRLPASPRQPQQDGPLRLPLGLPSYLIPIAFVRNPAILFVGDWADIALAAADLAAATAAWTMMISGYLGGRLGVVERCCSASLRRS